MKEQIKCPDYYKRNEFEVRDIIAGYNLDFFRGNAIKYIARAGKKPGCSVSEDLQKAWDNLAFLEGEPLYTRSLDFDCFSSAQINEFLTSFGINEVLGVVVILVLLTSFTENEEQISGLLGTARSFLKAEINDINQLEHVKYKSKKEVC